MLTIYAIYEICEHLHYDSTINFHLTLNQKIQPKIKKTLKYKAYVKKMNIYCNL